MAITATLQPTKVQLSRNPIWLYLTTSEFITAAASNGAILFKMEDNSQVATSAPQDADTLQIQWTYQGVDYDVTLTWATTPDGTENQLPLIPGGESYSDYVSGTLAEAIDLHPILHQFWEVADGVSDTDFTLSAKVAFDAAPIVTVGTDWLFEGLITPPGLDYPVAIAGGAATYNSGFFIMVKVWIEPTFGDEDWHLITEQPYKPELDSAGTSGEIKVDLQKFIEPHLRDYYPSQLPAPLPFAALVNERQINKRFRIEAFEYYDGEYQNVGWRSDPFRVISGGLNVYELRQYGIFVGNFAQNFGQTGKNWLSYRPLTREVIKSQQHYLFWLNWRQRQSQEGFLLKATVYYTDGTNSGAQTLITDNDSEQYDTLAFNVGFDDNGLGDLDPSKTPYKYIVTWQSVVQGGGVVLANTITYRLLPDTHLDLVVFWRNSWNAIESTLLRGERKLNVDTDSERSERYPVYDNDDNLNSNLKLIRNNTRRSITFESGPMSAEELAAHSDMLRSKEIWFQNIAGIGAEQEMRYLMRDGSFEMGYINDQGQHIHGIKFTIDFEDDRNFSNLTDEWQ